MWKPLYVAIAAVGLMLNAPPAAAADAPSPTVVELFTSQGCYSCPPAETLLTELADRKDLVVLEWHVDYWDDLVYGFAGKWKDPFSHPEHTRRQSLYNVSLRGQTGVYTPQMVIGGRIETVGSQRGNVLNAIRRVSLDAPKRLNVSVTRKAAGLTVAIDGPDARPGRVILVRYDHAHTTEVKSGENKGKTLTSRNIVRHAELLGEWTGKPATFDLADARLGPNQGCAILVQGEHAKGAGPILGAANCPVNGLTN